MNDKQLADEIENRRQVNSEEFLGRFLRKHSDQIIAALRRSQPEGMVINHNSFECARWPKCGCKSGADVNQCVGLRQALSAAEANERKG